MVVARQAKRLFAGAFQSDDEWRHFFNQLLRHLVEANELNEKPKNDLLSLRLLGKDAFANKGSARDSLDLISFCLTGRFFSYLPPTAAGKSPKGLFREREIEELVKSAKILVSAQMAKAPESSPKLPPPPVVQKLATRIRQRLTIFNKNVGRVTIGKHAWQRFLERVVGVAVAETKGQGFDPKRLEILKEIFLGAVRAKLPKQLIAKRMVRHRGDDVIYLCNKEKRVEFVISRDLPPKMITIQPMTKVDPARFRIKARKRSALARADEEIES